VAEGEGPARCRQRGRGRAQVPGACGTAVGGIALVRPAERSSLRRGSPTTRCGAGVLRGRLRGTLAARAVEKPEEPWQQQQLQQRGGGWSGPRG
jgi:hypothetical protein